MKKMLPLALAAALILGLAPGLLPGAAAADLETALAEGPVHSTLRGAVAGSTLTLDEPLLFERVHEGDVWVLRITSLADGETDYVRVVPEAPTGRPGAGEMAERYAYNVVGGTTRCVIYLYDYTNYGGLIQVTDMDWVDLGEISGVNDRISSLKTGCNPVWFFNEDGFHGSYTGYIPANTNVPDLYSASNGISSFRHDLP